MENFETIGDYLNKYNPFALKDEKNRILHFKDYDEIYLHVLKVIRKYCKRGYVELPHLVKFLTQFDDETVNDIVNAILRNHRGWSRDACYINWYHVRNEEERMQALLKGLHIVTETEFSWTSFQYAWLMFIEFNDKQNKKDDEDYKESD